MNGYTFNHCTMCDNARQLHMLVPVDMHGVPCLPGDIVYNESDPDMLRPVFVNGICTYDTPRGTYQLFVDTTGNRYFADEFFHAE